MLSLEDLQRISLFPNFDHETPCFQPMTDHEFRTAYPDVPQNSNVQSMSVKAGVLFEALNNALLTLSNETHAYSAEVLRLQQQVQQAMAEVSSNTKITLQYLLETIFEKARLSLLVVVDGGYFLQEWAMRTMNLVASGINKDIEKVTDALGALMVEGSNPEELDP